MTRHTTVDSIHQERREKRGGGKVRGDSLGMFDLKSEGSGASAFDNFTSDEPTPETIIAVNEKMESLLSKLPDDQHRQIVLMRLEGYSNNEIATTLNSSLRTVERRLQQIRDLWSDV